MCVIAWAWQQHPRFPLAVLANRDEYHARPTLAAAWWSEAPAILAGRDLESGGTWLGLTRDSRFGAVTNRPGARPPAAPSRGSLIPRFLRGEDDAEAAAAAIAAEAETFAGFNLLLADGRNLAFVSNREPGRLLVPGIYAMANGALEDKPWKAGRLRASLARWCESGSDPPQEEWLHLLGDDTPQPGGGPGTAIFVRGQRYGTRAATVVLLGVDGGGRFLERGFAALGRPLATTAVEFGAVP